MITSDELLAPGRALESLARRAAHGHRPAWKLLLDHLPRVIDAESRWLYPALLHRHPGGARHALTMPLTGEHEQMLDMIEVLASGSVIRSDPMVRALQSTLLLHTRGERAWLARALRAHPHPLHADTAFGRYLARCAGLMERARPILACASYAPIAIAA